MSGRSSRSTLMQTKLSLSNLAISTLANDSPLHHVAPVAGAVADREEDQLLLPLRAARRPRDPTRTSRPDCARAGAGRDCSPLQASRLPFAFPFGSSAGTERPPRPKLRGGRVLRRTSEAWRRSRKVRAMISEKMAASATIVRRPIIPIASSLGPGARDDALRPTSRRRGFPAW